MHNAKTDKNQPDIVKCLRLHGATVQDLSKVGGGVPDLLVGYGGKNYLIEVKDGVKSKLNDNQVKWHGKWLGQVDVIHSTEEVVLFIKSLGS